MRLPLLLLGRLWLRSLHLHWPAGMNLPESGIILLWHEHLPICMRAFAGRGIHVLISKSADGEWAARACSSFGYRVHRGSSSRGQVEGLRALARVLDQGPALIGMALDGPRGPRRVAKPGSLWLAQRAGVPVIPVHIETRHGIRLGSWDRSLLPWPFSRVEVRVGPPLHAETLEEIEEAMRTLERAEVSASSALRVAVASGDAARR